MYTFITNNFMKKYIYLFIFVVLLEGRIESQSCFDLPKRFYSYSQAINEIQNAIFKFKDKLPYGKSSWISSAFFYSCDGVNGYIVISTDKDKEYIHEKVPSRIWTEFKNAISSGSYYVKNIKGRYELILSR
ncbi:MAG: hypothetical protein A2546_05610 [Sphingobacteriia bacterium RIFOXYD2_FULL_35_12]|nr:MAG: hypothetical protein A2472_13560 [Sphingobacteriia bacterium RIFOXYC2_FULL_35_18]OHC87838.1 MAG: hypothetical protein A2546_05610 [Sphingobacteriia bacterium RIFOXYD2_FULL_35_12]